MKPSALIAVFLVVLMAVPLDALARAGKGGGGFGSRGSRTFDRPMERSVTPPSQVAPSQVAPSQSAPMYRPNAVNPSAAAARPAAGAAGGFFQRNPMMGGLMAGMLGAGLMGMLFNSSALAGAGEAAPFASFLGMMLQFALIGGLIWLAMRFFRRRAEPAPAGAGDVSGNVYRQAEPAYRSSVPSAGGMAAAPVVDKQFEPSDADKDAFTTIIQGVQSAWSTSDLTAMRRLATPEIVSWLAEDWEHDASQGVRNVMEDVTLLAGDVTEAWSEGERDFVTARVTFSARDYTIRLDDNQVVAGDQANPVEATEMWTFVRTQGGTWLLSAIEQVE